MEAYGNITPRTAAGDRLHIPVSKEDYDKVQRGKRWSATVTDIKTGKIYQLRDGGCGIPRCHCDARVMG